MIPCACKFCTSTAEERCSWPMIRPLNRRAETVVPGDVFIDPRKGEYYTVLDTERIRGGEIFPGWKLPDRVIIHVQFSRKLRGAGELREYRFTYAPSDNVEVLGEGFCESPVCEAHLRDVGDRSYCADHWDAWQEIWRSAVGFALVYGFICLVLG